MQARAFLTPTFAGRRGYLAIWLGIYALAMVGGFRPALTPAGRFPLISIGLNQLAISV